MSYARQLVFPEAKSFHELFVSSEPFDRTKHGRSSGVPWTFGDWNSGTRKFRKCTIPIGPYCWCRLHDGRMFSLAVVPTDAVVEDIKTNMLAAGVNDSISFQIIQWPNGECLVVAQNSVIFGSRWLAVVDFDTVPIPVCEEE